MKDDLISKKTLIEALENWCGKQRYLIPEEVWNIIQAAPVEFDKENVLTQMHYKHADAIDMCNIHRKTSVASSCESVERAWAKAIEIVEEGGLE